MTSGASEFDLIRQCFQHGYPDSPDTRLGIGDDACLVRPPADHWLVQSLDTQVADVHFPANAPADRIAQRALRCAVSDLAAMGAHPQGFLLGLTLPDNNADWLDEFARGLRAAAHACGIALIGGDTTRGKELVIAITVQGWLHHQFDGLQRRHARADDDVWVSGCLGTAALALPRLLQNPAWNHPLADGYYFPEPRLALGQALSGLAHAALDISDGLLQDAHHIASQSGIAMELWGERIPAEANCGNPAWMTCLTGGDDYELLFTAAADQRSRIESLSSELQVPLHRIGCCRATDDQPGVTLLLNQQPVTLTDTGFRHF